MGTRRVIRALRNRGELPWIILGVALIHELMWLFYQSYPAGTTGAVEAITRQPLVVILSLALAVQKPMNKFLVSVCTAVSVFASIYAACEFSWLLSPWSPLGGDSCSKRIGVPIGEISCGIALWTLLWRNQK